MSLLDSGDALEAASKEDVWRNVKKFLGFKLFEVDKGFEIVPNPLSDYANVTIGDLPRVCREEVARWQKTEKRCVPVATRMLNDKALNPERIKLYGHMLKQAAESLRHECLGLIDACSRYPQMLEKNAQFIEKQQPPFKMEPFNLAVQVWSGPAGVKHWLGSADLFADFPERIQKQRDALEEWDEYYKRQGYVPPRVETVTLKEPDSPPVGRNFEGEPLVVEKFFDPRK